MAKLRTDAEYIRAGGWKCPTSPSGAHHWRELRGGKKGDFGLFICLYCMDVKYYPITHTAAIKATHERFYEEPDKPTKEAVEELVLRES